jgi:8-oxo-dGTP pyrophosphatase MutT (NUDIX family)
MARTTHGGGVVFRLAGSAPVYLLVEASGSKGRWVFPKGVIARRESAEETARREIAEEAGVEARAVRALRRVRLEKEGDAIRVEYFLMEYVREVTPAESREVRWFRFEEALGALDQTGTIRLLREAHELLGTALRPARRGGAAARAATAFVGAAPLGALVILVAALPFAPELAALASSSAVAALGAAGAALALAHPLGALAGGYAQVVLGPFDRHRRVRVGLTSLRLEDEGEAVQAERLRWRVRAAAVLTVLLPGVTAALAQLGSRLRGEDWWPALIPAAYTAAMVGPFARAVAERGLGAGGLRGKHARRWAADLAVAPPLAAGVVLLAFALARSISRGSRPAGAAFEWTWVAGALAGSLLSVLSAWGWRRAGPRLASRAR